MSALNGFLATLIDHSPSLLAGVTIVLAGGLLVLRRQRSSEARRRAGVWTMVAASAYLVLAAVPLPRFGNGATNWLAGSRDSVATASNHALTETSPRSPELDVLGPEVPMAWPAAEPAVLPLAAAGIGHRDGPHQRISDSPVADSDPSAMTPPSPIGAATRSPSRARPTPDATTLDPLVSAPVAPDTAAASSTMPWAWRRWLAVTAMASASLLLAHYLLGALRLAAILRRATPASPGTRQLVNVAARTRIVFAAQSVRPFCAGFLRPVIVLSPELVGQPKALAAVLRHEAAHLRARDPLVQTLFALLALPLALHPLFWWLRSAVRFESERLADERAAGSSRTAYARQLLNLVDESAPQASAVSAMAIFHRRSAFYRRIQMLLQPRTEAHHPLSRIRRLTQSALLFGLVATAASTFGVEARAQDPARANTQRARYEAERAALETEINELKRQIESLSDEVTRQQEVKGSNRSNWNWRRPKAATTPEASPLDTATPPPSPPNPGLAPQPPSVNTTVPAPAPPPRGFRSTSRNGQYAPGVTSTAPRNGQSPNRRGLPGAVNANPRGARSPSYGAQGPGDGPGAGPAGGRRAGPTRTYPAAGRPSNFGNVNQSSPGYPTVGRTSSPSMTGSSPNSQPSPFSRPFRATASPMAMENPPAELGTNGTTASVEAIVALTSRLLDLDTDIEVAKSKLEDSKALAGKNMISQRELRREMARLGNLERKRKIARGLVDGEMKATKLELSWLKSKMKEAKKPDRIWIEMQRQRAEGRLDALRAAR